MVKDGLALCVAVNFNSAQLSEADINLVRPDAALGLRLACASFDALPAYNVLRR